MENEGSVFISAGDPSADFPGKLLIDELKSACPDLTVFGLGGRLMQDAGLFPLADFKKLAVLGFWEVVPKFRFFRNLLNRCAAEIRERRPRAVILIDYPGFNLRLAERIKPMGIPIFYFIAPQVWAWGAGRVRTIQRLIDRMLVIFPFEADFFGKHGIAATYVGHPIAERLAQMPERFESKRKLGIGESDTILALLPGSRRQEVKRMLPVMVRAADVLSRRISGLKVFVAGVEHLEEKLYTGMIGNRQIDLRFGETPDIVNAANLTVTSSGTATIECAWLCAPMIVIYRTGFFTYHIARRLVTLDKIAMVNIVAGKRIVPELIQGEAAPDRIVFEAERLLQNSDQYEEMVENLRAVRGMLSHGAVGKNCVKAIQSVITLC